MTIFLYVYYTDSNAVSTKVFANYYRMVPIEVTKPVKRTTTHTRIITNRTYPTQIKNQIFRRNRYLEPTNLNGTNTKDVEPNGIFVPPNSVLYQQSVPAIYRKMGA